MYVAEMTGLLLSSKYISWCSQACTQVPWCCPGVGSPQGADAIPPFGLVYVFLWVLLWEE